MPLSKKISVLAAFPMSINVAVNSSDGSSLVQLPVQLWEQYCHRSPGEAGDRLCDAADAVLCSHMLSGTFTHIRLFIYAHTFKRGNMLWHEICSVSYLL